MFKEQEIMLAQQVAGLAIWEWIVATDEMRWLPGSVPLWGRPLEELRTREALLGCIAREDVERVRRDREDAVRELADFQAEYRVRWPNGELRWLLATGRGVVHPEYGPILIGVTKDVTEAKRAHEELRDKALLLDLAYEPILVRDSKNLITYWNKGAERFYGYSAQEAVGRVSHELLRAEFPEPLNDITARLRSSGWWEGELVHTTRDGRRVHVQSRWQRLSNDGGTSTLETNFDLSHQKALQAARAWEEKALLLGEMSHEINNPLAIATSAVHLLKSGCDEPHQEYLKMLEGAIDRIADFVRRSNELHRNFHRPAPMMSERERRQ